MTYLTHEHPGIFYIGGAGGNAAGAGPSTAAGPSTVGKSLVLVL